MKSKIFFIFSFLFLLTVISAAGNPSQNIKTALVCLHDTIKGALAVGMLLLVVLAAVVYAVGQMLGAETRARASVWATAMFTGAIIGAIIFILVPYILGLIAPDLIDASTGKPTGDAELSCPGTGN